jgi:hypothetical protein
MWTVAIVLVWVTAVALSRVLWTRASGDGTVCILVSLRWEVRL